MVLRKVIKVSIFALSLPIWGISQNVIEKKNFPYYLSGSICYSSGLGSYRNAGYKEGISFNAELGRFVTPKLSLVLKLGFNEFTLEQKSFSENWRNYYQLPASYKILDSYLDKSSWIHVLVGPQYSIPINQKKRIYTDIKLLFGIHYLQDTPVASFLEEKPPIENRFNIYNDHSYGMVGNMGFAMRKQIFKVLHIFLETNIFYSNDQISWTVNTNTRPHFYDSKKQESLIINVGGGVIINMDRSRW